MGENPLRKLESFGQSVWLDFLSRGMLLSGEVSRLINEDGLSGMTSNPAIFEKAITGSHDYDEEIRELALAGKTAQQLYRELTIRDIVAALDLFRPLYDRTQGKDGFVSLELNPHLARDTDGSIAEAHELWALVQRPNLLIKVPGTLEGLPVIRRLLSEGINVNITLLFGLPRYRMVVDAYLDGLTDRLAAGQPIDRIASSGQLLFKPHRRAGRPDAGEAHAARLPSGRGRRRAAWARGHRQRQNRLPALSGDFQ